MAIQDFFSGLKDTLSSVGDFAKDTLNTYNGVYDAYQDIKDSNDNKNTNTTVVANPQASYNPNISFSDIMAMPNMPLLLGGAALLVVALVLMKR